MSETLTLPKIPQNKIDRLLGIGDWGHFGKLSASLGTGDWVGTEG
ncbi:MAG: hypothetical protein HEQ35_31610 [Gloeotrichia echinulata IR180]